MKKTTTSTSSPFDVREESTYWPGPQVVLQHGAERGIKDDDHNFIKVLRQVLHKVCQGRIGLWVEHASNSRSLSRCSKCNLQALAFQTVRGGMPLLPSILLFLKIYLALIKGSLVRNCRVNKSWEACASGCAMRRQVRWGYLCDACGAVLLLETAAICPITLGWRWWGKQLQIAICLITLSSRWCWGDASGAVLLEKAIAGYYFHYNGAQK